MIAAAMPPRALITEFAYDAVYTEAHLVVRDNKFWLPIVLDGKTFGLPMVNVMPKNDVTMAIAWLDPNPQTNPELSHAAASALAGLLGKLKADLVVMPSSSKSEKFIQNAAARLDVPVVKLLGGSREKMNEEEIIAVSEPGTATYYLPVTGVPKMMSLSQREAVLLRRAVHQGLKVVLADDVRSTGETLEAMTKTLVPLFGEGYQHTAAVLAYEALLNQSYPPPLSPFMHALMAIPEIGGLEKHMLYSIANRAAIPPAALL